MSVVIDANVLATADGLADQASGSCITDSVDVILAARDDSVILDADGEVLRQYKRCYRASSPPSVAQEFLIYILNNEYVEPKVHRINAELNVDRGYEDFPIDPALDGFDRDDRVYVAVALASGLTPPIQNATDRDWWEFREPLGAAGIEVNFICRDLMMD